MKKQKIHIISERVNYNSASLGRNKRRQSGDYRAIQAANASTTVLCVYTYSRSFALFFCYRRQMHLSVIQSRLSVVYVNRNKRALVARVSFICFAYGYA